MTAMPPVRLRKDALPIVSVGREPSLLHARKNTLEAAGYTVLSVTPEQAEKLAHETQTRIWLFCGSVESSSLIYLACAIRRHSPESRLLLVECRAGSGIESSLFHRVVAPLENAALLTRVVQELTVAA